MKNRTAEIFKPIFEKEMNLPNNEICKKCDAIDNAPLLPWVVGSKFFDTKEKILFVGKPHRDGAKGIIIDPSSYVGDDLANRSWAYWSYTKQICINLYGKDDPWDNVCFTNIIKCSNVSGKNTYDITTPIMADSCIRQNGVIFKEIATLKPKHIVFYTYSLFRGTLRILPFIQKIENLTPEYNRVKCGNKSIGWWYRKADTEWGSVKILVTAHPQFKNKHDFVKLITDWIKEN